jgi:integrase
VQGKVDTPKSIDGERTIALGQRIADVRAFHEMRQSSITNSAAAGTSTAALMARAGHADLRTTQAYVDLAGESLRAEAERLEERLGISTKFQYKIRR